MGGEGQGGRVAAGGISPGIDEGERGCHGAQGGTGSEVGLAEPGRQGRFLGGPDWPLLNALRNSS